MCVHDGLVHSLGAPNLIGTRHFELATAEIKVREDRLETLTSEKRDVEIKLHHAATLQVDEASQSAEATTAGERYEALKASDQRIRECATGI